MKIYAGILKNSIIAKPTKITPLIILCLTPRINVLQELGRGGNVEFVSKSNALKRRSHGIITSNVFSSVSTLIFYMEVQLVYYEFVAVYSSSTLVKLLLTIDKLISCWNSR